MKILLDPWGPARLSAKNKQSPEQVYNEDEDFETMY